MESIILEQVSKKFLIPHTEKIGLKFYLFSLLHLHRHTYEPFYALHHINLRVKKGEFLGIIGSNGSGKSTLLKIISNVIKPTTGNVIVHGKISPFLELGVGFQNELTVKENVYFYGCLLGLTNKEISKRFDTIIQFAGLEKFVDTKLKNLSSGMIARLGFSVIIQVDADILLVDEVLAVGDVEFQKKCYETFKLFKKMKKTILFVSHDISMIHKFSDRIIHLEGGMIKNYHS